MNILIIGYGFVGQATEYMLKKCITKVQILDPQKGFTLDKIDTSSIDYSFICVPTPLKGASLDISTVKEVYDNCYGTPVIRSTIGPDQVDNFPKAIILPEFLREKSWKADVDDRNIPIIIGVEDSSHSVLIAHLNMAKHVIEMGKKEASFYKLARNSALALRVSMANELYNICQRDNINYEQVKQILVKDSWIGGTHYDVPGPDGQLGFGGSCFPKDLTHMTALSNTDGVFLASLLYNNRLRK